MPRKTRKGIKYPKNFMKRMKHNKKKKIRNTPLNIKIVEQLYNNAVIII